MSTANSSHSAVRWSPEKLGASILSEDGYRITCQPMARGGWYNAFAPYGGRPLASGTLERCLQACESHRAAVRAKGKRWFKGPSLARA